MRTPASTYTVPFAQSQLRRGHDPNVLRIVCEDVSAGWEQWYLLTADRHWDNPHSLHDLQRRHLDWAAEAGAGVIDLGDFFCVMQGRYDPRRARKHIRPEHDVPNYLDAVVESAVEWFAPWADRFAMIGVGNHEKTILKNQETDLQERLIGGLNGRTGSAIQKGYYGGWVNWSFRGINSGSSLSLYYHHGYGGGGPVTKGVIQHARRAAVIDADIVASGHVHESWILENVRLSLNRQGNRVEKRRQVHVCVPTYKEEYGTGADGWHVELGRPPKPVGAMKLRFFLPTGERRVRFEVIPFE